MGKFFCPDIGARLKLIIYIYELLHSLAAVPMQVLLNHIILAGRLSSSNFAMTMMPQSSLDFPASVDSFPRTHLPLPPPNGLYSSTYKTT